MRSLLSIPKFVRLPSRPTSRSNSPQTPSVPSASSSLSWDQLFADAVEEYKKQTGKELPIQLTTQLTDLSAEKVISVLEEQAHAFDKVRKGGTGVELVRKLKPVVDVVLSVNDVLGKAVALPYPPAAAIFSAVGVLLQGTKNVFQSYDALVDLFDCPRNFLERVRVYLECSPKSTVNMKGVLVKMLAATLSVLAIATKEIKKGKLRKYGEALLGDTSIQDALQRLDRITGEEARMVAVQGLEVVCGLMTNMESVMKDGKDSKEGITGALAKMDDLLAKVDGVQEDIKEVKDDLHDVKRVMLDEKLYQWLSPPDPSTNYNNALTSHSKDTGAWLFGDEEYTKWKEGGSFLWIYGKPGSGKSVLSSAIIQDLCSQQNCGPVPYYYFDFADSQKQDLNGFLSSLVVQICEKRKQCRAALSQLYESCGKRKLTDDEFIHYLKSVLSTAGQIYIVIDALDECPGPGLHSNRDVVLRALQGLVGLKYENLHICVTSRPEVDIQDVLDPVASQRISLDENGGHQRDITTYTRSMVENDGVFKKWGDKDKDFIIEGLVRKANGMFRWVECQLQFLSRCRNRKQLVEALEGLPKTLYETYERILQQIDQSPCPKDAHRVLQWLVFAARPMTLEEVVDVLAVDLDAKPPLFEIENRLPEPRDVLAACSSLVVLRESNMQLELAHFSVQQYLLDTTIDRPQLSTSDATLVHGFIARTCLTYLLQFTDPLDESALELFPLASYAAEFWIHHVKRTNIEPLLDMILQLLEYRHEPYINWIRISDVDRYRATNLSRTRSSVAHPVYYVALAGLYMVLEKLIGEGPDVNAWGGRHGGSLQAASSGGHVAVVELLLEHGADVNAQGGEYGSALQQASSGGRIAVVELLLEHGADVNAQGGRYGSALQQASSGGPIAVVQLLLEHGADVNAQGGRYDSALQAASSCGRIAVVELLLEHGADVNAQSGRYGSALQAASSRRHDAIVQLLLDNGATANLPVDR